MNLLVQDIPTDVEIECYAVGCDERGALVSHTPWGRGAFCKEHGAAVVAALPESFPAPVGDFPGWVEEAFAARGVDVS